MRLELCGKTGGEIRFMKRIVAHLVQSFLLFIVLTGGKAVAYLGSRPRALALISLHVCSSILIRIQILPFGMTLAFWLIVEL